MGDWSLNAPGAPVGMCVVRLGPLAVGLAAKSQSGKANFETCTRQLWQLSKEPSTAGTPTWCVSLRYQAIVYHGQSPRTAGTACTRPHTLTDKAGLARALAPAHIWWAGPA